MYRCMCRCEIKQFILYLASNYFYSDLWYVLVRPSFKFDGLVEFTVRTITPINCPDVLSLVN
jgi:hypothetical protein